MRLAALVLLVVTGCLGVLCCGGGGGMYVNAGSCREFFRRERPALDGYAARWREGGRGVLASGPGLPRRFIDCDVKSVEATGTGVRVELLNGAMYPARSFVYVAAGVAGLPAEVTTSWKKEPGYYSFVPLDEHWYYYEWDM